MDLKLDALGDFVDLSVDVLELDNVQEQLAPELSPQALPAPLEDWPGDDLFDHRSIVVELR
ncbi:hypothetical protein [Rhodosalinus sp. K401]|uniref:hypothetical protein n=1 Tax=Rhodosalinus sp. K401 TaxID=3239195 RepID=UPI003524CD0D